MGLVRTNVMLDSELWQECKRLGAKDDRSASYYLNQVLRAAINKRKPKKTTEMVGANALDYIPLKSGSYGVTQEYFDKCQAAYPKVNAAQEFSAMKSWCEANPSKRKTRSGIERFINSWLSRANTTGGSKINMAATDWANEGLDIL